MAELVSVIIPVYNGIPYLEECLESVKRQTYTQLEIIMINDGSADSSEELLHAYAAKDPRFRLYNQENHGLGYTRNRGISLSSGSYLFFLDADDAIPPQAIESLVTAVKKSDADYAVGKVVRFNEVRKYIPIRHLEFGLYDKNIETTLAGNPELLQDSIACNKLWKKSLLVENKLLFKEGKYYEDLALTLKAAVLAKKIAVIDQVVYEWRVRDDEDKPSITQQQMKLDNTLHRLEALVENRHWLLATGADEQIVAENDLKSLLDIIRLHALKYALIDKSDREEWEKGIGALLQTVPASAADRLPDKEKVLYGFLADRDLVNLELFSRMLLGIEKEKRVVQESSRFVFHGSRQVIDVTPFFKPVLVIDQLRLSDFRWMLHGQLEVPKASAPVKGRFYAKERTSGQEIEITVAKAKPAHPDTLYPYEEQCITAVVEATPFLAFSRKTAFDFYYELPEYADASPARVRLPFTAQQSESRQKAGGKSLKLYRTNYGNLSLVLETLQVKSLLKKFMPFLKRQ